MVRTYPNMKMTKPTDLRSSMQTKHLDNYNKEKHTKTSRYQNAKNQ